MAPLLDQVYKLAQLEAFDVDAYVRELGAELPAGEGMAELEARDAALRGALDAIDAFAARAMKLRLEHGLAADGTIEPPLRKVLAGTIVGYAGDLDRLRRRVHDIVVRMDPRGAAATTDLVVDAAAAVLGLRDRLRDGVFELARDGASAALPAVTRVAKERAVDDPVRQKRSAARRDLEAIVARPEHIATAPWAQRLAALPAMMDEPDAEEAPSRWDLLELD